jgi:hypothetical protein
MGQDFGVIYYKFELVIVNLPKSCELSISYWFLFIGRKPPFFNQKVFNYIFFNLEIK